MTERYTDDAFELRLSSMIADFGQAAVTSFDAAVIAGDAVVGHGRRDTGDGFQLPSIDRRVVWLLIAAGLVIALSGVLVVEARPSLIFPPEAETRERPILASRAGQIITIDADDASMSNIGTGTLPAWSPDGTSIAYVQDDGLWVMFANGTGRRLLTDGVGFEGPVWAPDGRALLVARSALSRFDIVSLADGIVTFLGERPYKDDGNGDWAPDGDRIIVPTSGGLRVVDSGGRGQILRIAASDPMSWLPRWSPDGTWIAYDARDGVHVVHPDDTDDAVVATHPATPPDSAWATAVAWSADGHRLAVASPAEGLVIREAGTWRVVSSFRPEPDVDLRAIAWAPDGDRLALAIGAERSCTAEHDTSDIIVVNADGTSAHVVATGIDCSMFSALDW